MNETVKSLTTRRSCKNYADKHIDKECLAEIIEAGLHAPSGMNRQTAIFVAISDEEVVEKLSKMNAAVLGVQTDPFYGAKDVIVVLAKKVGTYIYDGSLAMGNLLNAAWSMGIGCCWIHRALEVFETEEGKALLQEWGITDEVEGIGFCTLGYAKEETKGKPVLPDRVKFI
ncbi:MAG: nitroreductase [Clostridia bacterium]|nr:nitroreductase [Clostridia bacterium]